MLNEEENINYKNKNHQITRHTIGPGSGQFTAEVIKNSGAIDLSDHNTQYSPIHIILSLITLTILQI